MLNKINLFIKMIIDSKIVASISSTVTEFVQKIFVSENNIVKSATINNDAIITGSLINSMDDVKDTVNFVSNNKSGKENKIVKIIDKVVKFLCVIATISFALFVGYILITIIPYIIQLMASMFAIAIAIKLINAIIRKACISTVVPITTN